MQCSRHLHLHLLLQVGRYGSKRLSTASQVLHLHSIAPVPDLAALLFATDLEHTPLPAAAAAGASVAAAELANGVDGSKSS
jgi:hypothetical protein